VPVSFFTIELRRRSAAAIFDTKGEAFAAHDALVLT
jgi:hypothetical protein